MRSIFREPARSFVRGFEAGLWDPAFGLENVRFLSARLIFSARLRDFRALREAAKWYALAAESGYAPAQGRLAQLYETGQGRASGWIMFWPTPGMPKPWLEDMKPLGKRWPCYRKG